MQPSFLQTPQTKLAYLRQEGALPTVMFLSGFKSDMTGTKAAALAAHCEKRAQAFVRFDYSGHGQSGGDFMDGTIGAWKRDALAIFDEVISGDVMLIGSSMGGWLALLIAGERRERVRGIIGIATAPDFTERLIWDALLPAQKQTLMTDGVYYAPSCYGEAPYPITRQLIEEGRNHLLLDKHMGITCPLHLLHGTKDEDVPVAMAHQLVQKIPHAQLTAIEGGNHRLSAPQDLYLICTTLDLMLMP